MTTAARDVPAPPPDAPVRVDADRGAWLVTGYDEAVGVLLDTGTFSNVNCIGIASFEDAAPEVQAVLRQGFERFPGMVELDPPVHTRYRTLVNLAFTPRRVAAYEPRIRELADGLIDAFPAGRVEFMRAFALPLPGAVIGEVLGLPAADMPMLQHLSDAFKTLEAGTLASLSLGEQLETARDFVRFQHYAREVVEERRRTPGDDLISSVIQDGMALAEPLSLVEEISMVIHLIFAGQETTVMLLGGMMLLLMTHRDQWQALCARPELIPGAVEESLRCEPPVLYHQRRTTKPARIGAVEIPAGEDVHVVFAAANRDARRFPDPDRFDVARGDAGRHLSFGRGVHFCVGAPLARLEAKVTLEQLTSRLPELRLATGTTPPRDPHEMLSGLTRLELEW
ncbi:MAG TPA: cytochrome P450 [Gaiellaceae bacterium]|nr:cytochrome P450 [Gaiellaceae bacterium]